MPTPSCSSSPRCPTTALLRDLHDARRPSSGSRSLVEAHDEAELDRALADRPAHRRRQRARPRRLRRGPVGRRAAREAHPAGGRRRRRERHPLGRRRPPHGRRRLRRGARRRGARARRRSGGARAHAPDRGAPTERGADDADPPARRPDADRVVQRHAGHARADAAAAAPGHEGAGRPRRPRAAVPDGADRAGGDGRPVGRHPGRGARHPAAVAADAAGARRATRARARHARAHLLQGRVGVAGGLAQAEHRGAAGVLQQGRGDRAPDDRDRRRPVGHRAVVRVHAVRPRLQGLHGARVVRRRSRTAGS